MKDVQTHSNPPSVWDRLKARWWLSIPALALVACALVGMSVFFPSPSSAGSTAAASFEVLTQREGSAHRVHADSYLREGDRIRFVVDSAGAKHLLIASLDGAGRFGVYFPSNAVQSGEVPGFRQELPNSVELNAAVGLQRVYAVFSDTPVTSAAVRDALQEGDSLEKVAGVRAVLVREFHLEEL